MSTEALIRRFVRLSARYFFLLLGAAFILLPLVWILSTSLKSPANTYSYPPQLVSRDFAVGNYVEAFTSLPFGRFILNTVYVALVVVVGQVFFSSLAGYAFAKLRFPGSRALFVFYLSTMMVPEIVLIIPNFIIIKYLGWIDTYKALIVPYLFGSAFGTYLLRQFFLTLPNELVEAAKIDGCGPVSVLFKVLYPNMIPALTSLGIFSLVKVWNDFMWPLTVTNSVVKKTLAIGLTAFQGLVVKNWGVIMAGAFVTMIPLIAVFLLAQRFFIQGITLTGMK